MIITSHHLNHTISAIYLCSFPDSGWECLLGGSASNSIYKPFYPILCWYLRQSLINYIPSQRLGTREIVIITSHHLNHTISAIYLCSFPDSGWECLPGGSASNSIYKPFYPILCWYLRQSLINCIPSQRLGTRDYKL